MTAYNPGDISIIDDINVQRQPETQQTSQKIKSIALRLGTLFSYLGNVIIAYVVMYERNVRMAKEYFIYITPSKPFFKIWIVIYIGLLLVILHNMYKNVWKTKSQLIFILSNCLFIISTGIWALETIEFVAISGMVLATVDNTTIWFWRVLMDQHLGMDKKISPSEQQQQVQVTSVSIQRQQSQSLSPDQQNQQHQKRRYTKIQLLIVRNILSFYIGWMTVAGTVITGLACVHWWGMTLCQQFVFFWITTPIAATALYLFMALKMKDQYKYCFGYILSVLWGLIGAGIASVNNISERNYC